MAVKNKGMVQAFDLTGAGLSVDIDLQPAAGKMWWFTSLRYALSLVSATGPVNSSLLLKMVNPTITQKTWTTNWGGSTATITESGEISSLGLVATNGSYIRFTHQIGDSLAFKASFFWFGLEVDV